ncbi:MAG: VCBS repeat-containing protein, partial [Planctomycetaceae bacterium]|nr:VCBS repeat-containing protein [Planctomycetaceae bacterium]
LTLDNTRIYENYTTTGGGGLSIFLGSVVSITDTTIEDNGANGGGGGIFSRGQITMTNSILQGNVAGADGGGILQNENGVFNTELSRISGNIATGQGGAIYTKTSGTVNLKTTTVSGNDATRGAGLYSQGNIVIRDSTFFGNDASQSGGGLILVSGTAKLINSTISGNTANFGGGIYNDTATVTTRNVTIANNAVYNNGGGIALAQSISGDNFTLYNTIVAGNLGMGSVPSDIQGDDVHAASANNIIGDISSTGGLLNLQNGNKIGFALSSIIEPTLADNGGATLTHATVLSSVAIDAGNNSQALDENNALLTTDQRGQVRRKSDVVDVGAFEGTQTDITVTTPNDVVNQFDGLVSLREAIIAANGDAHSNTIHFNAALDGVPIILTILGTGEDESLSGDLDVTSDITIMGNGRTNTIIDGGADIDGIANTPGIGEAVIHVLSGADLHVEQVKITGGNRLASSGDVNGGGIYSKGDTLTIINSEISENLGSRGGGVSANGNLTVDNSTISYNTAHTGGGIHTSGNSTVLDSAIFHNVSSGIGGGIYSNNFNTIEIRKSNISDNMAGTNGGGISFKFGLIIDSTISGNIAQSSIGGVSVLGVDADVTIINSTISGNSANFSAGGIGLIAIGQQNLQLVNSTIYGNIANTGGGIHLSSGSVMTMDNSIIAGTEGGADLQTSVGAVLTGTHNLIEDGLNLGSLTNTITGSPMLGQLADNGGPTFTHAPKPNSPVLNSGNNTKAVDENLVALANDQRGSGFARIITRVDIGAFEGFIDPYSSIVGFTNGNWWLTAADGLGVYDTSVAASGPASSFKKVLSGDFNGDGVDDLACWLNNGDWRVGLADGNGNFTFSTWTNWTHPDIKEIHVGDFNDDGLDDIIGLFKLPTNNRGRWWVGMSNGTQFLNRDWGDFGNYTGIAEVLVGNFDGVKGDDLSIITASGNVFMVKTSNTQFQYLFSHNWNINNGFNFVQAGDFNGDGRDDIVAVFGTTSNRSIFAAKSTGPATGFASLKFADITASQSFDSLVIGDFNGDGKDDVAARLNTTKWWVGLTGTNVFNFSFWTTWSFATNGISDVHVGSTNRDAMSDILGRAADGNWYTAESNGTTFNNRVIDAWSSTATWQYVQGGADFNQPAAETVAVPPPLEKKPLQTVADLTKRYGGVETQADSVLSGSVEKEPNKSPLVHQDPVNYELFAAPSLLEYLDQSFCDHN